MNLGSDGLRGGHQRPIVLQGLMLVLCLLSGCSMFSSSGSSRPARPVPTSYTVRSGDTLALIASRYNLSVNRIVRINSLSDPNHLHVGQRLVLLDSRTDASDAHLVRASARGSHEPRYRDGRLAWPVPGVDELASRFGPRFGSFHDGIDISAEIGTPVIAAHDGTVIYADNELSGYGNLILLRHSTGLTTVYGHNDRLLVSVGDHVKKGTKVAEAGASGRASGPHLHFEVRVKDPRGRYVAVDPVPLFSISEDRPRFRVNERLSPILAKINIFR